MAATAEAGELVATLPAGAYQGFHDDLGYHLELDGEEVLLVSGGGKFEARKRTDGQVEVWRIGESASAFERQPPVPTSDATGPIRTLRQLNVRNKRAWGDTSPPPKRVRNLADINEAARARYGR